eukprot:CAMPEP_0198734306 /NCGR_PEP_ID=MMETSP1475-20131203/51643_1 /TAXON_ID= ORGANISM="Unidentified sp., Strain CCMP1999" /NCGR_SAMPLE_ID=MMETSP1475 /ASSEMBLY_ACC=CAM_ASM_001111 /LENGTH=472 /DNA_ID=CAMNT_0044497749 /DNA_START=46 /DNA_END=1464 /DNA_ORIENTATION=-
MEVIKASATTQEQPKYSGGYASTYDHFNFGKVRADRQELLSYTLDRLQVMKEIHEQAQVGRNPDELTRAASTAEMKFRLTVPRKGEERLDRLFKDESSHFLLRTALSKTFEQREFLLKAESILLASRLSLAGTEAVLRVLDDSGKTNIEVVKKSEDPDLDRKLDEIRRGPRKNYISSDVPHYKVAFELLPSQVGNRKVFVQNGVAYAPEPFLIDILVAQFRSSLSQSLSNISRMVNAVESDECYGPILSEIRDHFTAVSADGRNRHAKAGATGDLSLHELENENIPAGTPLCMSNLLKKLHEDHHLRHGGRLQLGLYLKTCGLSMEESLTFWKNEFGKGTISSDRFDKQYAYSIRHTYGKEGKRRELGCYGCMKIISSTPGPGEHHGCPYQNFSEPRLKGALGSVGVPQRDIPAIVERAKGGHYQVACGMTFRSVEAAGEPDEDFVVTVPSEYFNRARELRARRENRMDTSQ